MRDTTKMAKQGWQIILVSLCSCCIALVVGCKDTSHPDESQSKSTVSVPRYGGTYHKALRQEPLTLDPAFLTDIYATSVVQQIFDGLVQFDANLNVVPCIAKSWEASRDGLVWTFHIRQGVKFHHGREVHADDFVYTFTRILDPHTASPRAWLFERVQGAQKFRAGEAKNVAGLQALDAYTLQITLSQPYAPFINLLGMAQAQVLPREEVQRLGAEFGHRPVGTGPFRFVNWVAGEEITLEVNETYYDGRPFLDRLYYRIMTNQQDILAEFEKGALEDVDLTGREDTPLSRDPRFRFVRKPLLATVFLWLDTRQGPLSNHKVRQAVNHAINREAISSVIRQNRHIQARGILPLGMPGSNPDLAGYTYDPARARQLLAEAGYPGGKDLPPLELWTGVTTTSIQQEHEMIKRDLERLGIRVELFTAENWKHYKTAVLGKRPGAIYRTSWFADFPDPDNFLFSLFHSQSTNNYSHYSAPAVDHLLEQARSEGDYLKRIQLYRQAEALIMADAPAVNLVYYTFETLFQPYVQGVELSALGEQYLSMKKIWLDAIPSVSLATPKPQ
jgi:peptide/nickel transport system substrate-binding protein/oligopeptide transport system substrate-binding protein